MVWPLPPHFQCQEFGRDTKRGGQRLTGGDEAESATERTQWLEKPRKVCFYHGEATTVWLHWQTVITALCN